MSNDKPRLRSTYRQNQGGWHHHSPVSPTEDSLTHTHNLAKQQFGTRGLSGASAPLVKLSGNEFLLPLLHSTVVF